MIRKFSEDEKNTRLTTVLLLKIGGRTWNGEVGIHGRHLDTEAPVQYVAIDKQRQTIGQVSYTDDSGKPVRFSSTDTKPTPAQLAAGETSNDGLRRLSQSSRALFRLPDRAVDEAMAQGRISPDLPYIRKKAVEVLKVSYPDRETASREIASALDDFYRASYPDMYREKHALVAEAISQVQAVYSRNVFPAMGVTWGTYPNNLGHMDSPGCFRCHDGSHTSADGRTIPNDCDTCHTMLAMDDPNPKILTDLGMK